MKNFNAFYLIIFLSITLFSCCKDEPKCQDPTKIECENYDPCYNIKPVSASFKILETVTGYAPYWQNYDTDTLASSYASFVADIEGAEYKWEIGAKTYTGKKVSQSFIGVADKTVIPVTLIVKKQPNKGCNPNDDGIDTITRNLVIRNESKLFSFYETKRYHGSYTDSPKDTFTMSFYVDTISSIWETYNIIEPLIKGYPYKEASRITYGYRQIDFSSNATPGYSGRAFLKPNDSLEVNFEYYLPFNEPKKLKTFLGKKVR
jgi:hypothetical protein